MKSWEHFDPPRHNIIPYLKNCFVPTNLQIYEHSTPYFLSDICASVTWVAASHPGPLVSVRQLPDAPCRRLRQVVPPGHVPMLEGRLPRSLHQLLVLYSRP